MSEPMDLAEAERAVWAVECEATEEQLCAVMGKYDRMRAELEQWRRLFRPDPGPGPVDTPEAVQARLDELCGVRAEVETREEWAILSREVGDDAEGIEMCEDEQTAHRQLALHYGDRHRFRYARVVRRDQPVAPEAPWVEASPSTPTPTASEPPRRPDEERPTSYFAPNGAALIAAERTRQVAVEGWVPEHDDRHTDGELVTAAAVYLRELGPPAWPWSDTRPKLTPGTSPAEKVRELTKAGALIAAEIDRLNRARLTAAREASVETGPLVVSVAPVATTTTATEEGR